MRKDFFILALSLLQLLPVYAYDNNRVPQMAVRTEVTEPLAVPIWSENATAESVVSGNQTITLKNPTFQELRDFILRDPTSRNEFVLNEYECRHFATEVN